MSEDKELREKISEALKGVGVYYEKDEWPTEYGTEVAYSDIKCVGKEEATDKLLALIHADRQRWLKELLPEEREKKFIESFNGLGIVLVPLDEGFNECLSLIKEKAGIKE